MATAPPKRSFFNKPSWASSSTASAQSTYNPIFESKNVYEGILEAEKIRKAEEAEKAKVSAEKASEKCLESNTKRRRISKETKEGGENCDEANSNGVDGSESEDGIRTSIRSTPKKQRTPAKAKRGRNPTIPSPSTRSKQPEGTVIVLSDDTEEDDDMYGSPSSVSKPRATIPKPKNKPIPYDPEFDDEDEEDDYTRELKQKAREKARLQKLGIESLKTSLPTPSSVDDARSPTADFTTGSPLNSYNDVPQKRPSAPTVDDPLIRIMVTPRIPNTKPLIVNRRASQSIKQVIEVWCMKQGFDAAMTSKVNLYWRGTRLWSSSTMQGPLRQLKKERPTEVFSIEGEQDGNEEQKGGRIEVDAMTEEIYQEYLKEKERIAAAAVDPIFAYTNDKDKLGESFDVRSPEFTEIVTKPVKKDDGSIVIRLSCRTEQGLPPMLLRVRPNTVFSKIMAGFKKTNNLGAEKDLYLVFDGNRLDPDDEVKDAELENEDTVEVHLR